MKLVIVIPLVLAATVAPAAATEYIPACYMINSGGEVINLESLCRPAPSISPPIAASPQPTQPTVPIERDAAPVTASVNAEVASVKSLENGNTEVKLLVRFPRGGPETGAASVTVTTSDGQTQFVSVSRAAGRVQNPIVQLRGRVHSSAITVTAR